MGNFLMTNVFYKCFLICWDLLGIFGFFWDDDFYKMIEHLKFAI